MEWPLNNRDGWRRCRKPDGMEADIFCASDPVTGSGCYLLVKNGACAVVDAGCFPLPAPALSGHAPAFLPVFLTHGHCDHISALNSLRERFPVLAVCSRACSEEIQDTKANMSRRMEAFLYYKSNETKLTPYAPFRCGPADLCFEEEIRFLLGGWRLHMKRLPGHTPGSSLIFLDGALFSGDYLLPGERVVTRLPGGSQEQYETYTRPWLQTIADETWIYPGHGREFQMCGEARRFHEL